MKVAVPVELAGGDARPKVAEVASDQERRREELIDRDGFLQGERKREATGSGKKSLACATWVPIEPGRVALTTANSGSARAASAKLTARSRPARRRAAGSDAGSRSTTPEANAPMTNASSSAETK